VEAAAWLLSENLSPGCIAWSAANIKTHRFGRPKGPPGGGSDWNASCG
jgi:hypothetical protein